jgi:hypothetical protein
MARRRSSRQGTSHETDRPFGRGNASIDQPQRSCHEARLVGGEERSGVPAGGTPLATWLEFVLRRSVIHRFSAKPTRDTRAIAHTQ